MQNATAVLKVMLWLGLRRALGAGRGGARQQTMLQTRAVGGAAATAAAAAAAEVLGPVQLFMPLLCKHFSPRHSKASRTRSLCLSNNSNQARACRARQRP